MYTRESFKHDSEWRWAFLVMSVVVTAVGMGLTALATWPLFFMPTWAVFLFVSPILCTMVGFVGGCVLGQDDQEDPKEVFYTILMCTFYPLTVLYVLYLLFKPAIDMAKLGIKGMLQVVGEKKSDD